MSTSDSDDVLATDISQWTRGEKARYQAREALDEELEEQEAPEHEDLEQAEVDVEIRVTIPVDFDRDEYTDNTNAALCVRAIAGEASVQGQKVYKVLFEDGHIEKLTSANLTGYTGGAEALSTFSPSSQSASTRRLRDSTEGSTTAMFSTRNSKRRRGNGMVDTVSALDDVDDDEIVVAQPGRGNDYEDSPSADSDNDLGQRRSRRVRSSTFERSTRTRRSLRNAQESDGEDDLQIPSSDDDDDIGYLQSDVLPRKRQHVSTRSGRQPYIGHNGLLFDKAPRSRREREPVRQSGRSTRHQGDMEEVGVEDIYRSDSDPRPTAPPKAVGVREVFKDLSRTDAFRIRHTQQCDTCGNGTNFAPLVYCQGCVLAYHKSCLGNRSTREHLVTKVGENDFVLQCRRCISFPRRKDHTAPDQGKCQDCRDSGASCTPFRSRKTNLQEQKEREENEGQDPIYPVNPERLNNASNVLFRCITCFRGFHFEHLPPRSDLMEMDSSSLAAQRFAEYCQDWSCKECATTPGKVSGLVAWKPIDEDNYDPSLGTGGIDEDEKAYLVRWENKSYFRATWMPGPWVWGVTVGAMRKAFARREESRVPKMRTEDAIPEEYLRTDIVLDVKYTSIVDVNGEEIDKARIREVSEALIKFKGLGYEDAVWEKPPATEDVDRWTDFVTAYNDWVAGKYVHIPKSVPLKARLEKARALDFATKLEKKKQPDNLEGGELMKYQLEGLNWLYYKWYSQNNAVLADEMGLGKTIQIIGFLATLVQDWNCFPFLVVVPNSTCANWRREVKQWAPSLRVVAYFGSKEARDLAYRYELYPRGSKEIRCHIVVTSYDAASDDSAKRFFKSVPWQGLIVDEGQRLKNDKNLLYSALSALKVPLRILLTGTPLQNNARELFNLLQFLDDSFDAAALELQYENLDSSNIPRLHDLIRPFFLRRTKAQVLTFLPPMAQIILPVSMSLVQKKLYRSILAKNPDLMRAIFAGSKNMAKSERASLSNILMQLRKCLCHPFVYSQSIEERNVSQAVSHRNLTEASGKLQLLEVLLPKLQERGHRVLIFSQFLDMLSMVEDFLDGLELRYQRLDGTMGSLQKQKRIDEFNAPNSELFAFLLSTRAGGVGINLATADTVIILDPDFNPHQDIQALSRAHRIGQKKKVLCFQLVTRASAEEKMMQIGRRKMALDHVLIDQMDADDDADIDLESVLKHGAAEIFNDDGEKDIKYDPIAVNKLLDRSHIEETRAGEDKSAENQFSFARVWANNELADSLPTSETEETAPDPTVWEKILKEREREAAAEAAAKLQDLGRGRRAKVNVDYGKGQEAAANVLDGDSPLKARKPRTDDESDTDFQAAESEGDSPAEGESNERVDPKELEDKKSGKPLFKANFNPTTPAKIAAVKSASASKMKKSATKPAKIAPKSTKAAEATSASKVKKPTVKPKKLKEAQDAPAAKKQNAPVKGAAQTKAVQAPSMEHSRNDSVVPTPLQTSSDIA